MSCIHTQAVSPELFQTKQAQATISMKGSQALDKSHSTPLTTSQALWHVNNPASAMHDRILVEIPRQSQDKQVCTQAPSCWWLAFELAFEAERGQTNWKKM